MRSQPTLDSFTQYCNEHPEQRFWQALKNWSGFKAIYAKDNDPNLGYGVSDDGENMKLTFDLVDTYYIE